MRSLVARGLCAALLLFSGFGIAAAQSASPSPAPAATPLGEIAHVYTSDRADETLKNAARTTYVVTHEEIVRHGYRTIGEAIAQLPGVSLSPYGAIGAAVQYGLRGSSAAQVLVLVDGLPAPGSFADSVEVGTLPVTGVERIEVVEGGGSTLFGTGAIGGIVNIITQRKGTNTATLRYGSFGDRELRIETDNFQFSRVLARNDFGLPDGSVRTNSDYQATTLHANAGWRMGGWDAALRAGIMSDRGGAPGPIPFVSTTSRETDLNEDANLTLTRRSAQAATTLQVGGTTQRITFGCTADPKIDPNCFVPVEELNTEGRFDFNVRNVVAGANEQLLYGVDLSRGAVRADGGGVFSTNAFAQSAIYLQENSAEPWGRLYYGIRGERDGSLGGEFSPSAGFVVRVSKEASIKGNIATAFRAPNASELYFPGYGNPNLHPERAKVADLTILDARLLGGAALGWFSNRTNNLIVPVLVDPKNFVYQPQNIDHAFMQGLTLDVRTLPLHGFTAALNITDLYRAEDLDTAARLPDDPVFAANLRLEYGGANGALDGFGVFIRMAGRRQFFDSSEPPFARSIDYASANAYVRLRAGRDLLLTLRGYNLGNERYAATSGFPMPGRSYGLELSSRPR